MNLSSTITDNVTELLVHIVEFVDRRNKLLMENVLEFKKPDFVPRDLDVTGFADLMTEAVSEHVSNERLLLRDTDTIRFGTNGIFESHPVVDEDAKELFEKDIRKYLKSQVKKISENMLNKRVASELLAKKRSKLMLFEC